VSDLGWRSLSALLPNTEFGSGVEVNVHFSIAGLGPFHTDANDSCELFARMIHVNSLREHVFTVTQAIR